MAGLIIVDGRRVDAITGEGREGCGFGPCLSSTSRGGAGCYLCDTIAQLEQPGRARAAADPADVKPQANAARDGAPALSGEKERRHPMWNKRKREGPHRSNV